MSLPFVWISLSFIFGIILSKYFHPTLFLIFLIACICGIFLFVCKRKKPIFLILIALTGAFACRSSLSYPSGNIANFSPASNIHITATIIKPPIEKSTSRGKKAVLILRAEKVEESKVGGLFRATIHTPHQSYLYGDRLLLKGKLYRPYNFGEFDYKKYLASRRIYCLFSAKGRNVEKLSSGGNLFFSFLFHFRTVLLNSIDKNLSPQKAVLLKAILLGERSGISPQLKKIFIDTGTIHILSISGLHIGIIVSIFLLFFKFLRLPYKTNYLLAIILIILYAFLSGARVPVVRATIIAVVILAGRLLNRPSAIYNSLGFAAFLILAVQPLYLFDVGFQLSFLCVFFIVYLTPKIEKIFFKEKILRSKKINLKKILSFAIRSLSASLAVWLGIFPLLSYYFNNFTPITVLANLIVVPLLFFVVAGGFSFILFTPIPAVSPFLGIIEGFLLALLVKAVSFFSNLPFAHFHFSLTLLGMITCYFFLFLFTLLNNPPMADCREVAFNGVKRKFSRSLHFAKKRKR